MRKDKVVSEVLGEETAITPSDVYNAKFKNALVGGYDKNDVDVFLERVADMLETLINQVRRLKEQNEDQKAQIAAFHEMECSLRDALVSSQKFGENMVESARRKADALLEEARAARARADARTAELPEALRKEIQALIAARDRLRADIQAVLKTHAALIESIPVTPSVIEEHLPEAEPEAVADFEPDEPDETPLTIDREPWLDSTDDPSMKEETAG